MSEKINSDATDVYMEYVRLGRGVNGGLVAASRDALVLTSLVSRAAPLVKILAGLVDFPDDSTISEDMKSTIQRINSWISDYERVLKNGGGK